MNLNDEITPSINPGDDFYNYVNKKWRDTHPIPADKSRTSVFNDLDDEVVEQLHGLFEKPITGNETHNSLLAKKLYISGMDEQAIESAGIDPILPFVSEIEQVTNVDDIKSLITRYHAKGRGLVWRLGLDVDEKDSTRYVMTLSQSGLLLPNRDYYFEKGEDFKKTRVAYKAFLKQVFDLFGMSNAERRATSVYAFEKKLAAASNTSIENRDVEALYNPFTFKELEDEFPGFAWSDYQGATHLNTLNGLIVHQPKFIHEVLRLVEAEDLEVWRDYLIMHATVRHLPYLGRKYADLHFDFFGRVLTGATEQQDRYKRVIRSATSLLPEPVGKLYVETYFDETAKAEITDLVTHIKEALRVRVSNLDWMSERTKKKAYEKLDTFMPLLGYPDTWRSYESVKLGSNYVENVLALREFEWQYDVSRVTQPVNRHEWLMSPATVNAYYWANTNGITFPAAILQYPMFDAKGDFAANYGGIGMVIGHEIIHGFDDNGSKYDEVGNLHSWWQKSDRNAFEARTKALSDQYDSYEVGGQHVKGALTLGENIADLGGMLIAYDALQRKIRESKQTEKIDGFTPEQRFFMAQARIWRLNIRPELELQFLVRDPHSPGHLRVNGVVTNVDAWYEAWQVKETDALYTSPNKRVRIW